MKIKLLSLTIALILLISTAFTVTATEISEKNMQKEALLSTINISEEINNALNGIIDESVPEDILNQVDASVQVVPKNLPLTDVKGMDASDIFDICKW